MIVFRFLHHSHLVVLSLHVIDGICDLPAKLFVLVALDSDCRWLDVTVVRPASVAHFELLMVLVIHDVRPLIHGLVKHINFICITES